VGTAAEECLQIVEPLIAYSEPVEEEDE